MSTTLVILGAKRSKKAGLGVVSLQEVKGTPLVFHQIKTARAAGFEDVVVVGGASYRKMIRACKKTHVFRVKEPNDKFSFSMTRPIEFLQTDSICFVYGDIAFSEEAMKQVRMTKGNCLLSYGMCSSSLMLNCDGKDVGCINYGAGTKWAKVFKVSGEDIPLLSRLMSDRPAYLPHEYINMMIDKGAVFKHVKAASPCPEINSKKDLEKIL